MAGGDCEADEDGGAAPARTLGAWLTLAFCSWTRAHPAVLQRGVRPKKCVHTRARLHKGVCSNAIPNSLSPNPDVAEGLINCGTFKQWNTVQQTPDAAHDSTSVKLTKQEADTRTVMALGRRVGYRAVRGLLVVTWICLSCDNSGAVTPMTCIHLYICYTLIIK